MTGRPHRMMQRRHSTERPMSADPLSDVLRTVRLTGATFFEVAATAPWAAEQPPREVVLPKVLPGGQHLVSYHVVTEGSCFAARIGEPPIPVEAGEVVVFTRGDAHVMSSAPGLRAEPATAEEFSAIAASPLPFFARHGTGQGLPTAKLVCGFLACDAHPFNPLIDNLPPVIKASNAGQPESNWIGQFIRLAQSESANKRA